MNAPSRFCRSFTFAEYSKSMGSLSRFPQLLDLPPAELRHRPCALPGLDRLRARGIARDRARHHPLEDRSRTEHVVRHAEAPVLPARRRCARASEITREIVLFRGDAARLQVGYAQTAELGG